MDEILSNSEKRAIIGKFEDLIVKHPITPSQVLTWMDVAGELADLGVGAVHALRIVREHQTPLGDREVF